MKSLLVLLSLLFTLVLSGCKEGTIVYDIEFPRADSEEAQDSSVAGGDSAGREADPAVTITDVSVQEGAGTVQVTLSLDKAVPGGFILDVSTQASSALSGVGNDFNALSSQSLIFNGTPAETKTVSITINDDSLVEADETFQLVISKLWGTTDPVSITDTGTITINDDDSAAITIADVSVSENAGTATVTLTLDKATSGAFSLDLSTTDGSATTSDNDYSSLISQLVSFSGNPSENQTVSITLNDDLKVEDNETFTVVMSNLSGLQANISLSDTAQVTITDNDNATVTIDNVSAAENSGSAVATLRVDNPVQGGFWVSLLRADGSATLADSDYSAGIDNISFAGTAGETQTVSIPLVDDLKLEADETMLLTLGSASRPEIVISDNATVTITNDDTASLTIADVSVAESAGTATISVVLDNPVDGGFAVDVSSLDGTATTVDSDYTALSSPNQSFTGLAGETKTLNISLGGDTKLENDEQFSVQLSNLTNTTLPVVITDTATVTITNDDSATVTIADQTTAENSGPSVVTLSVDNAVQGGFSVDVSTSDGSATTADGDYTAVSSQTVNFTGTASETQTVSITLSSDTKLEADETLTLSLGSVSRSGITISDTGTVTVQNDDSAAVTIADVSVAENVAGGTATVTLSLDNAVQGGFAVDVSTSDGTATVAGSDYTAVSGQTVSFAGTAGETETVTVTLNNDAIAEGDEALTLGMSNLASTSLSVTISDTGTLTINDDDATTLTIADVSVAENSGPAVITLTSDKAVAGGFTVDVSTSDGTATTGDSDYTALSSQTVTFLGNAGESQTVNITLGADSKLENDETFSVSMSNSSQPAQTLITDTATVTITNDDSATVTIADQTTAENSGPSVVTLSVDNAVQGGFSVDVSTSDGSATTADGDYTAVSSQTVNFTGTASETQTVSITLGSDTKLEADETLTLSLGSVSRSGITISDTGTVTVQNDDSAAVTIADVSVAENVAGGTATVTLTLDNAVQGGFAVDVSTSDGTATVAGSDYTAVSGQTVSFAGTAGETETVTVTLNNDAIAEGDEALTLGMSNLASTSLSVTISDTGTLTINDDDATTLTIADVSVAENSGPAVITLTSDKAVAGGFTVDVSTSDGTATTGDSDYTALSSQTVTFLGNAGESQTVNITLGADSKLENDETFSVSMSNSSQPAQTLITDTATVTITNDDSATVTIADQTTAENSGPSVVTLSVDNAVQGGFSVDVSTSDGSATTADGDYTAVSSQTVTFTGTASETQTVSITLSSDTKLEADETLTLSLGSVSRSGITISDTGTVTVQNDDSAAVTIDNVSVAENVAGGTATVTLTLDNAVQGGFAVDVSTSDGTATVAGSDYTAVSGQQVTFAGTASETQTVSITLNNDTIAEGDEALTLGMSNLASTSLSVTISDTGTLTINDDDATTLTIADVSVAENSGPAVITLTSDKAVAGGFSLDVSTSDGTATTGDSDYTALSSQTVTFAGTAGETQTVNITLGADSKLENDETFSVSMSNSSQPAQTLITDTATVTITNDDSATVTIADQTTAENSGPSVVTLSVDNAVQGGFSVDVSTSDGSATTADGDYTVVSSQTVNFTGTASETQTVSIPLGSDTKVEDNETLILSLGSVSRSGITISDTGTVTVQNDDTAAVTIDNVSVAENVAGGTATVTLRLDNAVQGGFRLDLATSNGTATAGSDYTALSGQQVTFAGTASETQTVTISIDNDTIAEGDETLTLGMSNLALTSLPVTISDTGTLTINDDDGATVTIADVSVAENSGPAVITLSVDQAVSGGFSLDVSTSDGSATTADGDYTALSSQTVNFTGNAGESQTVNITLGGDSKLENDETFSVSMSNSSKPALTTITDNATVTILNDDSATVTISDNTTAENSGPSVVTLSLDNAVQGGFWVTVQRSDGSATTADGDYTAGTDNVSFTGTAGETQTINIPLGSDTKVEDNETLILSLGSVSRSGITISDTGTVTVQNDDTAAVTIDNVSVAENVAGGTATVTLRLDNAVQGGFRLDLATSNGTATAGSDYTALSGQQVTFAGTASETQTVTISIDNDTIAEGDETLTLGMSNLALTSLPVTISDTGTLTINDDDGATVTIADVSVAENSGPAVITLSVDQAVSGGFSLDVSTSDGSATTADGDYTALSSQTVTFLGNAGESQTVNITLGADSKLENDETFSVSMSNSSKSALTTITDTATVTITNDDSATVTIADQTTAENSGPSVVTLSVDNAVQGGFSVDVSTSDGSATTADGDYTAVSSQTVTFTGTASETQTVSITLGSDTKVEDNETLILSLGSVSRSGITITDTATVTVQNDDSAAVTIDNVSVAENVAGGTATVTLRLDNAVQGGFRLDLATSNGTATAGSDYTALSGQQVTFAGTASETQTVTISIDNDTIAEGDETVTLGMSNLALTSLPVTISDTGTLTINDDDGATVTIADVSVAENSGPAVITLSVDQAVSGGFSLDVSTSDGSATTVDGDYTALSSQTVNFTGNAGESQTVNITLGADSKLENDETFSVSMSNSNKSALTTITDTATVTITNDDSATVTIADQTTAENSGPSVVTLSVDNAVQGGFWVTVQRADGTATTADSDYTAGTDNVSFTGTAGETQTINIPLGSDAKLEADETLTLSLGSVSRSGITITDTATVTVQNDDSAAVTIADVSVAENVAGGTATITLSLDNDVQDNFTVDVFTDNGTALSGAGNDYTAVSGQTVTFAGTASETQTVSITLDNDTVAEGNEEFYVRMSNLGSTSLPVSISDNATVTITDDDGATVTIADVSLAENSGPAVITLSVDQAVAGGFTVDVSTSDGTATTGDSDYTALSSQTVTFTGNAGESQTVNITLGADSKLENDETFSVSMSNSSEPALTTITDTATVTITNDDSATVTISDNTTLEASDNATVTLSLDNEVQGGFWVTVLRADGTATTADSDYTAGTDNVSFTGTAGETQTINIPLGSDLKVEDNETLTLSLSSVSRLGITITDNATVTITNDDSAAVTIADVSVAENVAGGTATVTLSLDNAVQGGFRLDVATSDGTATAGSDYTAISGQQVTFAGTASETQTVTVTLTDDASAEGNETLTIGMSNLALTSLPVTISDTGTLTINDDEGTATVTIADNATAENSGSLSFTLTLNAATASGFTIEYSKVDITAVGGSDYTASPNPDNVSFAGNAGETQTITVLLGADDQVEPDETFWIVLDQLYGISPSLVDISDNATGMITNDDSAAVTVANVSVSEGDNQTLTLTLDNVVSGGFTLDVSTLADTATSGTDYTAISSQSVSFSGTAGETETVSLTTIEDQVYEGNESLWIILSNSSNASVDVSDNASVTITDDDSAGFTLSKTTASVAETGTTDTFTVVLDSQPSANVTLTLSDNDSSEVLYPSSLVFSTGNWSTAQTVTLTGKDDYVDDGNQSTLLTLTPSSGDSNFNAPTLPAQTMTVTTTDNDTAGFTISRTTADVSENGTTATFTVVLNTEPTNVVEFDINSDDLSEARVSPGSLTFSTGNWTISQTVTITGWDDSDDDDNVTSTTSVAIDQPNTLDSVYDSVGVQTINVLTIDDDEPAILSIGDVSIAENVGSVSVTLSLDKTLPNSFTVQFSTADGTAQEVGTGTGDYELVNTTVTFPANTLSVTQSITINDDSDVEDNETIIVSLGTPSDSQVSVGGTGTVTITNDDIAVLSVNSMSVAENVGSALVTLSLDKTLPSSFTVQFSTTDGTAQEVGTGTGDYELMNTTVTIPANTASVTQGITINDDSDSEANETFTVNLGTPSDSRVTGSSSGTVTITDNDAPLVSLQVQGGGTSVNEGSTLTIEATISPTSGSQTIVNLSTAGTATLGTDYSLPDSITINANNSSGSIILTALDDNFNESNNDINRPNETVIIDIDNITGGAVENGTQQVSIEIIDGDNTDACLPNLTATGKMLENELSWSLPCGSNPTDYDIYWSTSNEVTESSSKIEDLDPSGETDDKDINLFIHGGLDNGTAYYYRVAVQLNNSDWVLSEVKTATPYAPQCSSTIYSSTSDSNLVAYYPFEGDTLDVMSTGPFHLSKIRGDEKYVDGCVFGKSLFLDGNTYYENLNFDESSLGNLTNNFTVSVWFKGTKDLPKNSGIIATGDDPSSLQSQLAYDESKGRIRWRITKTNDQSGSLAQGNNDYIDGTWYHFVLTFNNPEAKIYIDGNIQNGETKNIKHLWERLRVGVSRSGAPTGNGNYWKGNIDELRIYDKTLSASEVVDLYQQSLPPPVKDLTVSSNPGIQLRWDAVQGATAGYRIFRSTSSPVYTSNELSSPSITCTAGICEFNDSGLSAQTYYYRVSPENSNGYSEISNEVNKVP